MFQIIIFAPNIFQIYKQILIWKFLSSNLLCCRLQWLSSLKHFLRILFIPNMKKDLTTLIFSSQTRRFHTSFVFISILFIPNGKRTQGVRRNSEKRHSRGYAATRTDSILEKQCARSSRRVRDHKRGFRGSLWCISTRYRRETEEERVALWSVSWERVLHMQTMQRRRNDKMVAIVWSCLYQSMSLPYLRWSQVSNVWLTTYLIGFCSKKKKTMVSDCDRSETLVLFLLVLQGTKMSQLLREGILVTLLNLPWG